MKNLTWQNPEQLFVAQELINKVKSKCCGIKVNYGGNCSRIPWKVSFPPKESAQELLDITNFCKKHGYITVKDLMRLHGVTKYHAQKVLSGYCEGEFPKMTREREGRVFIYRRIGV